MYFKGARANEEKKRESKEAKEMFAHYQKQEEKLKATESARKVQFKKIQEENLKMSLLKKNAKEQAHVSQSLKEKELVDSGAACNSNLEVR